MSTVSDGDGFRDAVAQLLRAASYTVQTEVMLAGKKVDLLAVRRHLGKEERIAIEAKAFTENVPLPKVTEFVYGYGNIVRAGEAHRAILLSKGDITAQGKQAIDSVRDHLDHFTWDVFQRSIFAPDDYLAAIVEEYDNSGIENFFVPPRTVDKQDLGQLIEDWLEGEDKEPFAVFGGYGSGKSTFAQRLAARLARKSLNDPSSRIPILVPLGELSEESRVESLIGHLLASRYRVQGYHFEVFKRLNRAGRLVVICDGLDEMKHGMTPSIFQREVKRLFELQEGASRLILLGRRNALGSDQEFRAVIKGKSFGATGDEFDTPGQPNCIDVAIDKWSFAEAVGFIKGYFAFLGQKRGLDAERIAQRVAELTSSRFEDLLERPVHAQMLCQIALVSAGPIGDLDEFGLYDRFITFLLNRETDKIGRFSDFSVEVRRKFNAAVSWWLLTKQSAIGASIDNIPISICRHAVEGIHHDFDDDALRRELMAGCLVEKYNGHVYFGHRSIQEFLAAEHLFRTSYATSGGGGAKGLLSTVEFATPEVSKFLRHFFDKHPDGRKTAINICRILSGFTEDMPPNLGPLAEAQRASGDGFRDSPWLYYLQVRGPTPAWGANEFEHIIRDLGNRSTPRDIWLLAAQAASISEQTHSKRNQIIANVLQVSNLAEHVYRAQSGSHNVDSVGDEDYVTYCLVSAITMTDETFQTERVSFDWNVFRRAAYHLLGYGFIWEEREAKFNLVPQQLYSLLNWKTAELESVRPFFNSPDIVRALRPKLVAVERKRTLRDKAPEVNATKPVLRLPRIG